MNYDLVKLGHVAAISLAVSTMAITLFSSKAPKYITILSILSSVMILITGATMVYIGGIAHGYSFPLWVKAKFTFWMILAFVGPFVIKKMHILKQPAFFALLFVGFITAGFAIFKPS